MGLLGDLLAIPVKIINVPIRTMENLISDEDNLKEHDRLLSVPLNKLAEELKKIDD